MRVRLVGEGTYPIAKGGVSTWSDQLVRGLPEIDFDVSVLAAGQPGMGMRTPANVDSVRIIPMWEPAPSARSARAADRRRFLEAWEVICSHAFGGVQIAPGDALTAWGSLVAHAAAGRLWRCITDPAALAVLDRARRASDLDGPATGAELASAAIFLANVILPIGEPAADADVVHVTSSGSAMLAAFASHREGIPILLSEHGVYLRERLIAVRGTDWTPVQRRIAAAFLRAITVVGYQAAARIAPVSDFNGRWAQALGADPARIATIYNGVDLSRFRPADEEPSEPVVVFVGRIDPLKDLGTLIEAIHRTSQHIPDVRLDIVGPVPHENIAYAQGLRDLCESLGMTDRVRFLGPTDDPPSAYGSGQVAVLASVSEGFPYGALEPMACGRPVVATRVGGVPECVGDAGALVRSRDPQGLSEACTALLLDGMRRAELGARARRRVQEMFTLDRMLDQFREAYRELVSPAVGGGLGVPSTEPVPVPSTERVRGRVGHVHLAGSGR